MSKIAVIGIGNPYRGDDGAGWAVIDALEGKISPQIKLCKLRGDLGDLLDHFGNYSIIYMIDACTSEASAGSWQRIDALIDPMLLEQPQTSTHGLSISQAISLARALDQLPSKLIIYAIRGEHYHVSNELSPLVAEAVKIVAYNILQEDLCMKKV